MMTSCQPRPHPQAMGMAASRASIGTATKMATRTFSTVPLGSSCRSPSGVLAAVTAGPVAVGLVVVSVAVVIGSSPGTQTKIDGADALRNAVGRGSCRIRLRNRNLRDRRLYNGLANIYWQPRDAEASAWCRRRATARGLRNVGLYYPPARPSCPGNALARQSGRNVSASY